MKQFIFAVPLVLALVLPTSPQVVSVAPTVLLEAHVFDNDQIKTIPTSPLTLVSAKGAGTQIVVHKVLLRLSNVSGYNFDDPTLWYAYLNTDSLGGASLTAVGWAGVGSFLLGATTSVLELPTTGYLDINPTNSDIQANNYAGPLNEPVMLGDWLGGSNYTAGNAGNVLKSFVWYSVITP